MIVGGGVYVEISNPPAPFSAGLCLDFFASLPRLAAAGELRACQPSRRPPPARLELKVSK